MKELIYADECYKIIGACFEVYREKGCGFLEPVFQECLQLEFQLHATGFRLGLLVNFGHHPKIEWERIVV